VGGYGSECNQGSSVPLNGKTHKRTVKAKIKSGGGGTRITSEHGTHAQRCGEATPKSAAAH